MNLRTAYRIVAILAIVAGAWASSLGQSATHGGPAGLSCSPAPCVLPPTQASPGPNDADTTPIAVDPSNSGNLIVGGNDHNCGGNGVRSLGFFISLDGGSQWNQQCMFRLFRDGQLYVPDLGPILGYDRNGVAYIGGYYVANGNSGPPGDGEAFQKSSDGKNWSSPAPAIVGGNFTPFYCWMAVDTSAASPYINSVYISCVMVGPFGKNTENQVVVAHSRDGGSTWQQVSVAPIQVAPDIDRNTVLAVGKNGEVYLTWLYCNSGFFECNDDYGYLVFSKSTDGGNTWTKPTLTATVVLNHFNLPNTKAGVSEIPAVGVDSSNGPHAGTLYVVMYNWNGTFLQVLVTHSTDDGSTWSKPVPVAPGITHDQFLPWISVSPSGLVGVMWLDRRNDPNNIDYQAFAAISSDGGLTFQPNVKLTSAFSDPNIGLGEYDGAAWDGQNYFLAAWSDDSNGVNSQAFVGGIRLK